VGETPELLTREWWLSLGDEGDSDLCRMLAEQWAKHYGGDVGDYLDPAIPGADLAKLRHGSRKVKDYVNRRLAHLDSQRAAPDGRGSVVTQDEIHDAIDLIGELFQRYWGLLNANSWRSLIPTPRDDWGGPLRVAWIEGD
jgi:hypothetical protein